MDSKAFNNAALKAHNEYRSKHGAKALKLNNDIREIAQGWADEMAKTSNFTHSKNRNYKDGRLGENIFFIQGVDPTGESTTKTWYDEIENYDFENCNSKGGMTGHFTQVVWMASQEAGFGIAKSENGAYYIVGNYYPAGNLIGAFKENVLKCVEKKKKKNKGCVIL